MIKIVQQVIRSAVENEPNLLNEEIILEKYFLGIKYRAEHSVLIYDIEAEESANTEVEPEPQNTIGFYNGGAEIITAKEETYEEEYPEEDWDEGY